MMVPSILTDTIDYGALMFSTNLGSTYFAINHFVTKLAFALGAAMSLAIVGIYGVDATSTVQTDDAITGLKLAFIICPILIAVLSLCFVLKTPIDQHRQKVIKNRLAARASRCS